MDQLLFYVNLLSYYNHFKLYCYGVVNFYKIKHNTPNKH